jgi:hypothetical protein
VDDHHQRRRGEPRELAVDGLADLQRFGAGGLPAGAGESVLDPRREDAEPDRKRRPGGDDDREVGGGEVAESSDRPVAAGRGHAAVLQTIRSCVSIVPMYNLIVVQ